MNKYFRWGAVFGLLAPFIGMFAGLQIVPFLGTVLMFPFVIVGELVNQPFGDFSTPLKLLSLVLSVAFWGTVFFAIAKLIPQKQN